MQLGFDIVGSGTPAVVFTHGLADNRATWDRQFDDLAGVGTMVAWDLRGHGDSEKPVAADEYSRDLAMSDLAEMLSVTRRSAGPAVVKTILVGHSLGGYFSLRHAILHPDEVDGLVLVAAGPGFRDETRRETFNRAVRSVDAAAHGMAPNAHGISLHSDSLVIERIGEITAPTLVIWGTDDRRFRDAGAFMADRLPNATSLAVDGVGHFVHVKAHEAVSSAIGEFLARFP